MSTKFEQLLDYLVNEEMDKANELFHDIVVEESRKIYESLIAEEAEEDEEMDESKHEDEEEMDEAKEEDEEEMDESAEEELEDSYMMDGDDSDDMDMDAVGGDATDDMLGDIEADDAEGGTSDEESAIFDIKNAIAELEAAFAELEKSQGDDMGDEMGGEFDDEEGDDDMGADDEEPQDEMMGLREYRETVAKPSGDVAGAGTGEKMSAAGATRSPISSGKGKPTTGADAKNILGKSATANEDGDGPKGKVGGLVKQGGKFTSSGTHNVDNVKSGVKTLDKVSGGHGAEKKGAGPGPVGAGTGDKAGQTSIAPETKKQFLPPHSN